MASESVTILTKLVQKQYLNWFLDWIDTATPNEKLGLQIINFIYDTRGLVKADANISQAEPDVKTLYHSKFDMKASEQFFKKKISTTAYQKEFGKGIGKSADPNNILTFMKVREVGFELIRWNTLSG